MRRNIMIASLLVVIALLGIRCDAASPPDPAIEMQAAGITLTDSSSFYTFAKDGAFSSGPVGMSGRTLIGHWKLEEHSEGSAAKVIVDAKFGWINGVSPTDDHRRIVFFIYAGKTTRYEHPKGDDGKPIVFGMFPESYYKCYWLVDEFTKIAKSAEKK